jgi:carbonyl reductase 1
VYLTSRDEGRGRKAIEELNKLGLQPNYHQLDIDDETSILKLKDYMLTNHGGIDVLVNNAAIAFRRSATEPPFYEQATVTLRTNFFSTHRVCVILFPLLRPHGRVVNVPSSAGYLQNIVGEDDTSVALRAKLASANLTCEELINLMREFVECVPI